MPYARDGRGDGLPSPWQQTTCRNLRRTAMSQPKESLEIPNDNAATAASSAQSFGKEASGPEEKVITSQYATEQGRWLSMYEQMLKIRIFEEHVNQLYLSAKMPGLAHLYIGEEAIAVGVCAALRRDDYITSTHRGHGHCLAKGASVDRMF